MQVVDFKINGHDWRARWRDEADESVFNEIFKLDEYRAAKDVIKNAKDPIVDVGAHAGFFTMYCRALNDKVKIFAIEPEENNLEALAWHLQTNKIKGVKVVAGALAQETGERELFLSSDSHNHFVIPTRLAEALAKRAEVEGSAPVIPNLIGNPDNYRLDSRSRAGMTTYGQRFLLRRRNDKQTLIVKALSLADFFRQNKIKKISLLKMDIEGGEYEVFAGMSAQDLSMVNFVILEYHGGREYKQIEDKLRIAGFGVQVFPSHFDKTMGFIWANNKRSKP